MRAAQTAQLEEVRKEWNAAPNFLKGTLKSDFEIDELRRSPFADRVAFITATKDEGNSLCQEGQYQDAIDCYTKALSVLIWFEMPEGRRSDYINLVRDYRVSRAGIDLAEHNVVVLLLNVAHCENKLGHWDASIYACKMAIDIDKYNVKALYRRAIAYYNQGTSLSLDSAVEDLLSANAIDPEDKAVSRLLGRYFKEKTEQDRYVCLD